jgi:O-acetyl-ADP-ribose deacetylase (regulator of RNase III)
MLTFRNGNIFELHAYVDALVNPVNCVGIMGKGLAHQFKTIFPGNFVAYASACKKGDVVPGKMFTFYEDGITIINFPTKRHWSEPSRVEDIESGLQDLVKIIRGLRIHSVALPALGCGLGGLDWVDVKKLVVGALEPLNDVSVYVLEKC